MDYKKLGLKCGLEIHQQLDTNKLFCNCPSSLRHDSPHFEIKRRLKAVEGELGKTDIAALSEQKKEKTFVYKGYNNTTCLVELDEEPPHIINSKALENTLKIAFLLDMSPFDEIHVMRKTVVDGSNTSGFQRTALVAENGVIKTRDGNVRINMLALEEDSARRIGESGKNVVFGLDRLGIPLVELRTEPDIHTPEQAKEAAEKIGLLMRMVRDVKRGIGTIRQDVNVSIKGGTRVELKGVQSLNDIPEIIKLEIERQQNLIAIRKILKKRKSNPKAHFYDIKRIFAKTESKMIKKAFETEEDIIGVKLPGFQGVLKTKIQLEKHLAKDLVEYIKHFTGVKGFIHSDELPGYGIDEKEIFQIRKIMNCRNEDAFAFMTGDENEIKKSLILLVERCRQFVKGVPKDVRDVNDDCTSRFIRPIPGASRMYPETDHLPIKLSKNFLRRIEIPEFPEEKIKKFKKMGLSKELGMQILHSEMLFTFEEFSEKFKNLNPTIIASCLLSSREEIRKRYGTDTSRISKKHFSEIFSMLETNKIAKEAIIDIINYAAKNPNLSAEEIVKKLKLERISVKELRRIIKKTISENQHLQGENIFQILMGFVMRKVRGRIDGEIVSEELKKTI